MFYLLNCNLKVAKMSRKFIFVVYVVLVKTKKLKASGIGAGLLEKRIKYCRV